MNSQDSYSDTLGGFVTCSKYPNTVTIACKTGFTFSAGTEFLLRHTAQGGWGSLVKLRRY